MAKTLDEIVLTRRSTRSFTGQPVSDATTDEILDIAAQALSSWGGHPVEFIVVRNRATLRELARCKAAGAGPVAFGDAAIVPIVDTRNLELWVEDAAVASTYILLAAEHVGVEPVGSTCADAVATPTWPTRTYATSLASPPTTGSSTWCHWE